MSNYDDGLTELGYCDSGSGYDWNEFMAWYDEAARVFYWASDAGCSCSSFGDYFDGRGDLENGGKTDALNALKRWASNDDGEYWSHIDKADVVRLEAAIRDVKVPR